ncbi:hypothetical protein C479_06716 [Halovivax asiaticus JCM 14624]|uniref:DUF7978 domain-containing protein n=1 Tax=Halovivax asiaticus JCM 14624 TaxID=1227490 RepID=M0BL15_9EURY|nr:hypothetical protein [Halovivax asiaticus]ELZ11535.1 hypothetical protein C479_06716 [Halovivax asiaticus JCM 14624]
MSNQPKYRHGGPVEDDESTADESRTLPSVHERIPVVGGLLTGAAAALTTYVLALLATFAGRQGSNAWGTTESPPHVMTEAGWTTLMNLGAGLNIDGESPSRGVRYGLFHFATSPAYTLLCFLLIVGAGYGIASCVETNSVRERLGASLLVVPAYVLSAALLATFATWEPTTDARSASEIQMVSVDVADAVLYPGVVFPAVLALLGASLAIGYRAFVANRDPY